MPTNASDLNSQSSDENQNWNDLLSNCDFEIAADEIRDMLQMAKQRAASKGEQLCFQEDFLSVLRSFLESPSARTARLVLEAAPGFRVYFEGCTPGGNFYELRRVLGPVPRGESDRNEESRTVRDSQWAANAQKSKWTESLTAKPINVFAQLGIFLGSACVFTFVSSLFTPPNPRLVSAPMEVLLYASLAGFGLTQAVLVITGRRISAITTLLIAAIVCLCICGYFMLPIKASTVGKAGIPPPFDHATSHLNLQTVSVDWKQSYGRLPGMSEESVERIYGKLQLKQVPGHGGIGSFVKAMVSPSKATGDRMLVLDFGPPDKFTYRAGKVWDVEVYANSDDDLPVLDVIQRAADFEFGAGPNEDGATAWIEAADDKNGIYLEWQIQSERVRFLKATFWPRAGL